MRVLDCDEPDSEYIQGFKHALKLAEEVADKVRQQTCYDSLTAHIIWLDIKNIEVPE